MKMTRFEAIELFKSISGLPKKEYNRFFLYSIEKTKLELKSVVDDVAKKEYEIIYDEGIRKFENERVVILEKYAKRDESGSPIVTDNRYDFTEDAMIIVNKEITELREQYLGDIERINSLKESFTKYLDEEIDVNIVKVSFKHIPETLESELFSTVMKLVKESDEEIQELG